MSPEERHLLERTLKLSEENHQILRSMRRAAHWAILWGIIKFLVIAIPLIVGFLFLEPHLGPITDTLKGAQNLINQFR